MQRKGNSRTKSAWDYALYFLARRSHSEYEIREKLLAKGFTEEAVTEVLERLKAAGFLDDVRFARNWAAYRMATHPSGSRRLRQELQGRGVPSEMAAAVVADLLPREEELEAARSLAERHRPRRGENREKYARRLARFLWQRGFDFEIVRQVLGERLEGLYIDIDNRNL
ncbi:MAG: regulatory protein RecX [Moorella humiferrea]|nr:regulatory protein RecX [Moorella humiferrea]